MSGMGALLGVAVALAVVLLASWVRARRPLPVAERIGPYVALPGGSDVVRRDLSWSSVLSVLGARRSSASDQGARRRAAGVGALLGVSLAALITIDDPQPIAWLGLGVAGAVLAVWLRDAHARRARHQRRMHIDEQVPVLADLLALGVSAGASPVAALDRATAHLSGPLAQDAAAALARIRAGESVEVVLQSFGEGAPSLRRLTDAVIVSLEQGAPLGEVIKAQALDARAEERRRLMEGAGRRDVAMLVPIVFLVLPTVVLIALYPGLRALQVVVP